MPSLQDAHILSIATDGFEETELFGPYESLKKAGAAVTLASLKTDEIQGEKGGKPMRTITPDLTVADTKAEDYDGLVLPGGTKNPDKLRMNDDVVRLVREFVEADKPVAAICHGPWLLVEADVVRGKRVTSWPSIRTDLRNAGAQVVDEEVVVDGNLVTSRKPDDVPAFTQTFMQLLETADAPLEGV